MMRTLMVENFIDILETHIQRKKPLIDIVLVMNDVRAYIQKHALEVHHMIDVGDDQDNIMN